MDLQVVSHSLEATRHFKTRKKGSIGSIYLKSATENNPINDKRVHLYPAALPIFPHFILGGVTGITVPPPPHLACPADETADCNQSPIQLSTQPANMAESQNSAVRTSKRYKYFFFRITK